MTLTPDCLEIAGSNERHKRRNFEKTKHRRNLKLVKFKLFSELEVFFQLKRQPGLKRIT